MKHPYPQHIAETVGAQFASLLGYVFNDLPDHDQDLFRRNADMILTALWDASRVEIDNIGELPEDAAFIDGDGFIASSVSHAESNWMENPVYVIYWGDTDE